MPRPWVTALAACVDRRHWLALFGSRSGAVLATDSGMREGRPQRSRVGRYLDCTWLSDWAVERARISSLSPTGCYVESRFTVPRVGEVVRDVTVTLPTGTLRLQGTVIEAMPGVGFAVRFSGLDNDAVERLDVCIRDLKSAC